MTAPATSPKPFRGGVEEVGQEERPTCYEEMLAKSRPHHAHPVDPIGTLTGLHHGVCRFGGHAELISQRSLAHQQQGPDELAVAPAERGNEPWYAAVFRNEVPNEITLRASQTIQRGWQVSVLQLAERSEIPPPPALQPLEGALEKVGASAERVGIRCIRRGCLHHPESHGIRLVHGYGFFGAAVHQRQGGVNLCGKGVGRTVRASQHVRNRLGRDPNVRAGFPPERALQRVRDSPERRLLPAAPDRRSHGSLHAALGAPAEPVSDGYRQLDEQLCAHPGTNDAHRPNGRSRSDGHAPGKPRQQPEPFKVVRVLRDEGEEGARRNRLGGLPAESLLEKPAHLTNRLLRPRSVLLAVECATDSVCQAVGVGGVGLHAEEGSAGTELSEGDRRCGCRTP